MAGFLSKLLTLGEGKQLKHYEATAAKINGLESEMQARSDQELRALTAAFRERAQNGEDLKSLLPEAFAAVARGLGAHAGACVTSTCSSSAAWL